MFQITLPPTSRGRTRSLPSPALLFVLAAACAPTATHAADAAPDDCDPVLSELLSDLLARSPSLAVARAQAAAASEVPAQARALAEPMLSLRTTSDRSDWSDTTDIEVMATQAIPPPGRRRLMAEAALADADASRAQVDIARLEALAEARRLYFELGWLEGLDRIRREEREAVGDFVSIARARYETGGGLMADVTRASAQVTQLGAELVKIEGERVALLASLNTMRGRPADTPLSPSRAALPRVEREDSGAALERAIASRPEVAEAAAMEGAARARSELARMTARPDVVLGGFYEAMDLGGSGDEPDEAGIVVGISLPVRRARIQAAVAEASQLELAASARRGVVASSVERDVATALSGVDTAGRQAALYRDVLAIQADDSMRSTLSGYSTGTTSALDVLDALRVKFEVQAQELRSTVDANLAATALAAATASSDLGPCLVAAETVASSAIPVASSLPAAPPTAAAPQVATANPSPSRPRRAQLGR